MRIAIDGRALEWYRSTGMGTYTNNLGEGLKKANHHDYTFVFSQEAVALGQHPPYTVFADTGDFWERVYNHPPQNVTCDVFHNPFNGFGLAEQRDYPAVITLHDIIPLLLPKFCGSPYREHFQEKIAKIVSNADHLIAVSKRTKEDIITELKVPPQKISVVYQGVEPIFRPLNIEDVKGFLQAKYDIEKEFILYVGGFSPRKNVTALIKAFAKIKEEVDWDLFIVGKKGKSYYLAENLVKTLNLSERVKFLGFIPREDLPYFYQGAKVFVFPSFYEGFGLPPLEAASCGTAVISSLGGSLPEILGGNAHYFNPEKDVDLAKAILELFCHNEDRIALAREGFLRSRDFSPLAAARKTLGVYESLCR